MKKVVAAILVLMLSALFVLLLSNGANSVAGQDSPDQIMAECSRRARAESVSLEGMREYMRACIRARSGYDDKTAAMRVGPGGELSGENDGSAGNRP